MKAFAAAVLFMLAGVVLLVDGPTSAAAVGLACLGIGFAFLVLVTVQQAWRRPRLHIVVLLFLLGMLMSTTGMPVLSGGGRGPLLDFLVYGGLFVMGLAAILGIRRSIGYLRRPATGTPSAQRLARSRRGQKAQTEPRHDDGESKHASTFSTGCRWVGRRFSAIGTARPADRAPRSRTLTRENG